MGLFSISKPTTNIDESIDIRTSETHVDTDVNSNNVSNISTTDESVTTNITDFSGANFDSSRKIFDSFNQQLSQPIAIIGEGASNLGKGLGLNLDNFFQKTPIDFGEKKTTQSRNSFSFSNLILIGVLIFGVIFIIRRLKSK